mmetsp:Transcript_31130/g.79361  ORF Transcript_31130/g.79361 Transcript_31130/m.79361 type:complete len:503 (-) Transcript_31130:905-2413(-)
MAAAAAAAEVRVRLERSSDAGGAGAGGGADRFPMRPLTAAAAALRLAPSSAFPLLPAAAEDVDAPAALPLPFPLPPPFLLRSSASLLTARASKSKSSVPASSSSESDPKPSMLPDTFFLLGRGSLGGGSRSTSSSTCTGLAPAGLSLRHPPVNTAPRSELRLTPAAFTTVTNGSRRAPAAPPLPAPARAPSLLLGPASLPGCSLAVVRALRLRLEPPAFAPSCFASASPASAAASAPAAACSAAASGAAAGSSAGMGTNSPSTGEDITITFSTTLPGGALRTWYPLRMTERVVGIFSTMHRMGATGIRGAMRPEWRLLRLRAESPPADGDASVDAPAAAAASSGGTSAPVRAAAASSSASRSSAFSCSSAPVDVPAAPGCLLGVPSLKLSMSTCEGCREVMGMSSSCDRMGHDMANMTEWYALPASSCFRGTSAEDSGREGFSCLLCHTPLISACSSALGVARCTSRHAGCSLSEMVLALSPPASRSSTMSLCTHVSGGAQS